MNPLEFLLSLPPIIRILAIVLLAIISHFIVRGVRKFSQWLLSLKLDTGEVSEESLTRRYPKIATIITILVSAITFAIYFMAFGFILHEFNVSLTAYLASASVIGLAIGFGSQGFVQDVVIGLTLIFSDTLNISDVVEISGQVGKVERVGLRFTTLINIHKQEIHIPNRNIAIISQFRDGCIRAYVDIQLPDELDEKTVIEAIQAIAMGMYYQHKSIILSPPENFGIKQANGGRWRYLRIKFRIWPGQHALIETTFKQRIIMLVKNFFPDYADRMVIVTYRVE